VGGEARNTIRKGRLSTVDLLIELASIVEKVIMFALSKAADLS
jgi:hypothetical protein